MGGDASDGCMQGGHGPGSAAVGSIRLQPRLNQKAPPQFEKSHADPGACLSLLTDAVAVGTYAVTRLASLIA